MSQEAQRRRGHQENARRQPAERRAQEPRHGTDEERPAERRERGGARDPPQHKKHNHGGAIDRVHDGGRRINKNKKHDGHGTSPTKKTTKKNKSDSKTVKIVTPREGANHQTHQES